MLERWPCDACFLRSSLRLLSIALLNQVRFKAEILRASLSDALEDDKARFCDRSSMSWRLLLFRGAFRSNRRRLRGLASWFAALRASRLRAGVDDFEYASWDAFRTRGGVRGLGRSTGLDDRPFSICIQCSRCRRCGSRERPNREFLWRRRVCASRRRGRRRDCRGRSGVCGPGP